MKRIEREVISIVDGDMEFVFPEDEWKAARDLATERPNAKVYVVTLRETSREPLDPADI